MNNSLEENFYQERRRPESLQYFSNAVTKFEKNLLKTQIDWYIFKEIKYNHFPN